MEGAVENSNVQVFKEIANHTWGSLSLNQGSITAGTKVDSYIVHLDRANTDVATKSGSITFDTDILGLIFNRAKLNNSDSELGPSTLYAGTSNARGIEGSDTITWLGTGKFLSFDLKTLNAGIDELRVITASPVPVPAAVWLLGSGLVGLFGFGGRKRKSNQA